MKTRHPTHCVGTRARDFMGLLGCRNPLITPFLYSTGTWSIRNRSSSTRPRPVTRARLLSSRLSVIPIRSDSLAGRNRPATAAVLPILVYNSPLADFRDPCHSNGCSPRERGLIYRKSSHGHTPENSISAPPDATIATTKDSKTLSQHPRDAYPCASTHRLARRGADSRIWAAQLLTKMST